MNQELWKRAKDLHGRALDLAAGERKGFLARECAGDPELLALVERLIESQEDVSQFLEPPPQEEIEKPLRLLSFDFRGCTLGEFELVERIGRGATGVVWRARQASLGREVAIKILAPHLCQSEEKLERFRKEAFAASRLHHPNAVSVLTVGEQEGVHYIAMEYVRGRSLQDILDEVRSRPLGSSPSREPDTPRIQEPETAARIVKKIAEALDHCHARGVIHRDIKPQNVLIDGHGEPRIIDFGLARILEEEGITDTGIVMGTPHYMSPEQVMALGEQVDFRTDIYSLGALLYELLTLERLFERSAPAEVPHKIVHAAPTPVREINPKVPRILAGICMKALRKNPDDRYSSARTMAVDLQRCLAGRGVSASKPSRIRELYHVVFHKKPWIGATAAVVSFGLLILLSPRATFVQVAVGQGQEASGNLANQPASSLNPQQDAEAERKKIEKTKRQIHRLESLFPDEPIHTKE